MARRQYSGFLPRHTGEDMRGCLCAIVTLVRLLLALLLILGLATSARADTIVRIEGKNFIAPDGGTLLIKGISLGNWLMP